MTQEWRPEGVGPHKTLAGNMFDPNIQADGQKGGEGVGGTSQRRVEEEGLEHIRKTGGGDGSSSGAFTGAGATGIDQQRVHSEGIEHIKQSMSGTSTSNTLPPPSNPGNDPSGGLPSGAGGVARTEEDTPNMTVGSAGGYAPQPGRDPATETSAFAPAPSDNDPTTGPPPTETGGDPATAASDRGMGLSGDSSATDEHPDETAEKGDKPPPPGGTPSNKLDNPSSIPTAGGERLGQKHWGESNVVPDNPKPRASEAGISSAEGQPDKSTSDNTNKNTGGASGGPQHMKEGEGQGEENQGMMDKIKSKLGK
ncbi:hypothetical protein MBLNU230_g1142t1 [Neophaeotheca triangularis]